MYQVGFYKLATKSLKKIPKNYQIKVAEAVKKLKQDPFSLDIKKLSPPNNTSHRLRIGDYRVFLNIDISKNQIIIVDIKRRTSQTYS